MRMFVENIVAQLAFSLPLLLSAIDTLVAFFRRLTLDIQQVGELCFQLTIIADFDGLNHHGMRES